MFSKRYDKAVEKYPMLNVIANGFYGGCVRDSDIGTVCEYIDTIERAENMSKVLESI